MLNHRALSKRERVLDADAPGSNSAREFRVAEQDLSGEQGAGLLINRWTWIVAADASRHP
jgi:hypothetical protein